MQLTFARNYSWAAILSLLFYTDAIWTVMSLIKETWCLAKASSRHGCVVGMKIRIKIVIVILVQVFKKMETKILSKMYLVCNKWTFRNAFTILRQLRIVFWCLWWCTRHCLGAQNSKHFMTILGTLECKTNRVKGKIISQCKRNSIILVSWKKYL